ncbi:MAG: bifunctional cytochrome P450/NADPH--P450 reductase [Sphingomonadaceae bacterium]
MATDATIPAPKTLPVIGNLHQIPKAAIIQHLLSVSRDFADIGIFKLFFGSAVTIWVTHPDMVAELSDETRFRKMPGPSLRAVRAFAGDGLFTAYSEEENWGKAHRILLPAFSQRSMRSYYDMILEVCDALIAKWEGAVGTDVMVADDMTRLTLDSIAIAGFGYRFNSFENEALDPFLEALGSALTEIMYKTMRLPIQQRFATKSKAQLAADIETMNELVDRVIAERRAHPIESKDLLNLMISAKDPQTGDGLEDVNIRYQVLTFLIAGHETTSGLLTFAFHHLLKNPHVLAQAYAEVDRVLPGDTRPAYAHVAKLEVIERIIKETMRLWPTAPAISLSPFEDEVIGGKYLMKKNRPVNVYLPGLHRDPRIWAHPDEFDIDRWLPKAEATHHPHGYKPFGNGARACIGRQFAMLEAKLAIAMILQKFAISDRHDYSLRIKESLSIKPDDFKMRIMKRMPHTRNAPIVPVESARAETGRLQAAGAGKRLSVVWGSSLGTARDIAEEIAERAEADGFETRVRSMDEALGTLPEDRVVVMVTATYNGKAPDSAIKSENALDTGFFSDAHWPDTKFAVLGIGSSSWPNYQAFPRRVDAAFEATGAQRLVARGEADTEGDFDGAVAAFLGDLWTALGAKGRADEAKASGLGLTFVDTLDARAAVLPDMAQPLEIISNDELVHAADGLFDTTVKAPRGSTRLIRVALADGMSYKTGDHVAIYAHNPKAHVDLAIERLGLAGAAQIVLSGASGRFRHLPIGRTVTVRQLLTDFVEIQDPLPKRALTAALAATRCPHTRAALEQMSGDGWAQVAASRLSLLGLLVKHPAIEMELETFVELSAAIAPRFYSIASSPIVSPGIADLIVGTLRAPAWSGVGEHQGFASGHMRGVMAGETVFGYVRSPNPPFVPPADPATPMILIGPGTGFAPFRGFLQERASSPASGPIHLFFGCKHPEHDWLCRDEMEGWVASGLITLHRAYSSLADFPHAYVQHALSAAGATLWPLIEGGAHIYICGDGKRMAPAVRDAFLGLNMSQTGGNRDVASDWLEAMIDGGRYHQDVYGFGK